MLLLLSLSSSPASSSLLSLLLSGVMFCMFFLFCFLRNVLHWFLVEVFIVITQGCVVDGEPGNYYFRLYDPLNVPRYAYGNHHGVLGISILLIKPICCALILQYFLDFCINSSLCATKLHDLESVGSATGHPTVVTVKQRESCFVFSPSKHRKEPLKAQYLKNLMERTDMNDFSKLKYLFFISHYNFLGFSQFSLWRSIYCHFHRKEWDLLVKGGTVSSNLNFQIQYYQTALLKL